ncbi:MAG: hypothetical protein ACLQLE_04985, partial [Desulfobaccales bacterium]
MALVEQRPEGRDVAGAERLGRRPHAPTLAHDVARTAPAELVVDAVEVLLARGAEWSDDARRGLA